MSTEELQKEVERLQAELSEINAKLSEVEKLTSRKRALCPGWNSLGEIEVARRQVRDSRFPVLYGDTWNTTRIVDVTDKWIVTRFDLSNEDEVKRYNRQTGARERTRSGYDKIDVVLALKIWGSREKGNK